MWRARKRHVTRDARLIIFISAGAHSRVTSRGASASGSGHARQGGLRARARVHSRDLDADDLEGAQRGRARSSGFSKTPRAFSRCALSAARGDRAAGRPAAGDHDQRPRNLRQRLPALRIASYGARTCAPLNAFPSSVPTWSPRSSRAVGLQGIQAGRLRLRAFPHFHAGRCVSHAP